MVFPEEQVEDPEELVESQVAPAYPFLQTVHLTVSVEEASKQVVTSQLEISAQVAEVRVMAVSVQAKVDDEATQVLYFLLHMLQSPMALDDWVVTWDPE